MPFKLCSNSRAEISRTSNAEYSFSFLFKRNSNLFFYHHQVTNCRLPDQHSNDIQRDWMNGKFIFWGWMEMKTDEWVNIVNKIGMPFSSFRGKKHNRTSEMQKKKSRREIRDVNGMKGFHLLPRTNFISIIFSRNADQHGLGFGTMLSVVGLG